MAVKLNVKIAVFLFLLMSLLTSAILGYVYHRTAAEKAEELRASLLMIAQLTSSLIDGDVHEQIPLSRNGVSKPEYREIRKRLKEVQKNYLFIRYIYTLAKNANGELCFAVDAAAQDDFFSYPGDRYEAAKLGKAFDEFTETEVHQEVITDQWGSFFSGYAPIRNSTGDLVALVGVDMSLDVIAKAKEEIFRTYLYLLGVIVLISLLFGAIAARWLTLPIHELLKGTQRVAAGNLTYQVPVMTQDEIGELASSFNEMAAKLSASYRDLKKSFVNAIKALTVALEAKDPYTKGHALRVGRYSLWIARELKVPQEQLENLEALSAMHDIGKIGIQDSILLKPSPLTDEEREVLRKHPEIGEEILKPLAYFEPELLKLIRSHHERPDGSGYPDGLKGDQIPILVSIVAVADAYDAMVTNRPYRKGMSPAEAFTELEKCSGKEYDARVVAALKLLITRNQKDPFGLSQEKEV